MNTNWKSSTCKSCLFRVNTLCKRFPPNQAGEQVSVMHQLSTRRIIPARYPVVECYHYNTNNGGVKQSQYFKDACGEYVEDQPISVTGSSIA